MGVAVGAIALLPAAAYALTGLGDVVGDIVEEVDKVVDEVEEVVEEITHSFADVDVDLDGSGGIEADVCVGLGADCGEDDGSGGGGSGGGGSGGGGGGGGSGGGGSGGGGGGGGSGGGSGGGGGGGSGGGGGGGGGPLFDPLAVGAIGPGAPQVCFYALPNYGGQSFCLYAGSGFLPMLGIWADRIASIQVIGRISVMICDNVNLTGSCLVVVQDTPRIVTSVFSIQLL
jgi:hypothetical protein